MSHALEEQTDVAVARRSKYAARATGYACSEYARSLSEFGEPMFLPRSGGTLLKRPIADSRAFDAMGPYPVFSCVNWAGLASDLESLRHALVTVTLVTAPFGAFDRSDLDTSFPELVVHYKDHFVADLHRPMEQIVSRHHRRNVRKALKSLDVRCCDEPSRLLDSWHKLYLNLVARHEIRGISAFSRAIFAQQLALDGCLAFAAWKQDEIVGMLLWLLDDQVAYYHLGAYSRPGYEMGASFALFWFALNHLAGCGVRWAALGAGAGVAACESGLTRFKRGWSTGSKPVYLCGRVLQPDVYEQLRRRYGIPAGTSLFPAYRSNESLGNVASARAA